MITPELAAVILHPHVHEVIRAKLTDRSLLACDNVRNDGVRDCDRHALTARRAVFERVCRLLAAVLLPRWPRVSVITPTWQRHDLLAGRCVPAVRSQQYQGTAEHVIVSDGPDPDMPVPGVVMLEEHRAARNRGLRARQHGTRLAKGDVIAYLDDDNAWRRLHLAILVRALLDSGADFAYSRALCHDNGYRYSIGIAPPSFAQIDTSLIVHRRELLAVADWQPSRGPADWDLVRRWLGAGAQWVFVPEITLDYYQRVVTL